MNGALIWENGYVTETPQVAEQPDETTTADDRPMLMVVTFKSGAQIRVDVDTFTVQKNAFGQLIGLKWTATEATKAAIEHIDLEQVAAVHTEWP